MSTSSDSSDKIQSPLATLQKHGERISRLEVRMEHAEEVMSDAREDLKAIRDEDLPAIRSALTKGEKDFTEALSKVRGAIWALGVVYGVLTIAIAIVALVIKR